MYVGQIKLPQAPDLSQNVTISRQVGGHSLWGKIDTEQLAEVERFFARCGHAMTSYTVSWGAGCSQYPGEAINEPSELLG
jgi:hypothetical protein